MNTILTQALEVAKLAAEAKLAELQNAGPKYTVHNDDFSGHLSPAIGTMLDVCGNAWIGLDGRNPLVNYIKKHFLKSGSCYTGKNWSLMKGTYKGYILNLNFTFRQEQSVNVAGYSAAITFLKLKGIDCHLHTYID